MCVEMETEHRDPATSFFGETIIVLPYASATVSTEHLKSTEVLELFSSNHENPESRPFKGTSEFASPSCYSNPIS